MPFVDAIWSTVSVRSFITSRRTHEPARPFGGLSETTRSDRFPSSVHVCLKYRCIGWGCGIHGFSGVRNVCLEPQRARVRRDNDGGHFWMTGRGTPSGGNTLSPYSYSFG